MRMGVFDIYPNEYIVLVAGSGRMRKATPIGLSRSLLEDLEPLPNLIAQKCTTEALFDALKLTVDGKVNVSGCPGRGFLVTDELSNFLNRGTTEAGIATILTELYDCRKVVTYQTKGRGKEILRDTQLGILSATTPEELHKAVPAEVIGAGLASRMLLVYEDIPPKPVVIPTLDLDARAYCVNALKRFQVLSGEIILDSATKEWCDECYIKRCYENTMFDDPLLSGYASRRFTHIIKVGILMAVGLTEELHLTPELLTKAEVLVSWNEKALPKLIKVITMSEKGGMINFVFNIVRKHRKLDRKDLIRLTSHRIDHKEVTDIIDTLIKSGQVRTTVTGASIYYEVV